MNKNGYLKSEKAKLIGTLCAYGSMFCGIIITLSFWLVLIIKGVLIKSIFLTSSFGFIWFIICSIWNSKLEENYNNPERQQSRREFISQTIVILYSILIINLIVILSTLLNLLD